MREKLMALIDEADKICDSYFRCDECPYRAEYGRNCINELIADHLIANGVTVPVRCKECKKQEWCSFRQRLMYEFGVEDGFCSAGERKDNGNPRDR